MIMPHLVALHGRAQVGKDTIGAHLVERYGYVQMSFAAPLKAGLAAMIPGWDELLTRKEATIPWLSKSPRELMQTLGTEWGRDLVHREIWLQIAEQRLGLLRAAGYSLVVFTDCRFENEAQWARNLGGTVWHVRRPTAAPVAAHASEAGVTIDIDADWVIDNGGTIEQLHARVEEIVGEIVRQRSAA